MPVIDTGQELVNRYRIVRLLGQGGFGAVYRAWDKNLGRPCAIKENTSAAADALAQFEQEARLLANLSHPNLARVTDYFVLPGQGQYLVMDYIDGQDLDDMLKNASAGTDPTSVSSGAAGAQAALPQERVLGWLIEICDALEYLHNQSPPVVHRDIKPGNIRITPLGRPVLVDFGISKLYDPQLRTSPGARGITMGYSPPEQYGLGGTEPRSDLYALGATAYHLLTGVKPPESVLVLTNRTNPPALAHQVNPLVSPQVSAVVAQAMAMEPAMRQSSALVLRAQLVSALNAVQARGAAPVGVPIVLPFDPQARTVVQPKGSSPPGTQTSGASGFPKRGAWLALAAALGLLVVSVIAVILYFKPKPAPNPGVETSPPAASLAPTTNPAEMVTQPADTIPTVTMLAPTTPATATPAMAELGGQGIVRLTFGDGTYYRAQLSPDQRHLVSFKQVNGYWQVVEIDPNGGGMLRLVTTEPANHYLPAFSSDGDGLILASDISGNMEIYDTSFPGGERLAQLTNHPAADSGPFWFPDQERFVFYSARDGDSEIYLGYSDGRNPIQLTNNTKADLTPVVSPDGKSVAFYSNLSGSPDIYLLNVDSGVARQMTDWSGREAEPFFSPDGQWIVFEADRSGSYDIWAIRTDGSDVRQVTSSAANEQMPSFSPDGRWVFYHLGLGGQLYDIYRIEW